MTKKTYGEKLKDPRWQKKRLQILERDEWMCQWCYRDDITLHVHHLQYSEGEPWEIDERYLIAICEECHSEEHKYREEAEEFLLSAIRRHGFNYAQIASLGSGFNSLQKFHISGVMASVIQYALSEAEIMRRLNELYFEELKERRESLWGSSPSSNPVPEQIGNE